MTTLRTHGCAVPAFLGALLLTAVFPVASTDRATPELPPILVSRQLAERAHLRVGDTVTLAGNTAGAGAAPFRVAGWYEPTPDPMRFTAKRLEVRMHLPDLNAVVPGPSDEDANDTIGAVNVSLTDPNAAEAFATSVESRAPGVVARPTARARDGSDPFAVLERFHQAVAIVTVLGSTAFLLALMVMRAEERKETVGIVRLIGISERSILLGVLVEGLLIATAGAVFGILVAVAAQGTVNRFFQWRYDTALVFVRVTPSIALRSIALSVPLGILAGVVGSWALLRRNIAVLVRR